MGSEDGWLRDYSWLCVLRSLTPDGAQEIKCSARDSNWGLPQFKTNALTTALSISLVPILNSWGSLFVLFFPLSLAISGSN